MCIIKLMDTLACGTVFADITGVSVDWVTLRRHQNISEICAKVILASSGRKWCSPPATSSR